jgi:hypothetical protein
MYTEIVATHNLLVQVFLWFLIGGLLIPYITRHDGKGFRKASFIFTFVYQALATMIAFSGLILLVLSSMGLQSSIILMIIIWVLLMFVEIRKYKSMKVANLADTAVHTTFKKRFYKATAIQILLVVGMVVLTVLMKKGIVAL